MNILEVKNIEAGKVYRLYSPQFSFTYVEYIDSITKLDDNSYKILMHEVGREDSKYPSGNYIFKKNWKFKNNKHVCSSSGTSTWYFITD